MKKISAFILTMIGILSTVIANAQWQSKGSGFTADGRNLVELIAVGDSVAWGMAGDAVTPIFLVPPLNEFTRTTDGGSHWTAGKMNAFPDYYLNGLAPLSGTLCYASISNFNTGVAKIVKTTDGGITWTEQLNYDFGVPFSFFADIYFFNASEGLVYGDQSDGYFTIFTTHDGGSHWTRVPPANMPPGLADESSYVFSSEGIGNTFWTVSSAGRIWKTTDQGLHWNAYQTQESDIEFSSLKMRDALHGLWGVHGELYRTNDGGVSWEEVDYSGTWFTNDLAYVPGTASTYVSTGAHDFPGYDPNNSLHGIGSSYSVDDGNTWITIDTAVEHVSLAMVNSYTGYTGSVHTSGSTGMFKYNGSALGYSCGNNLSSLCHKGNTICVANGSIANHLSKGDVLGDCVSASSNRINNKTQFENSETAIRINAYPNPFSSSATITYSIPKTEKLTLKIFDLMGRPIKTLVNGEVATGSYTIQWNLNDEKGRMVGPGIYFLRMQAGNYSETQKISVIK